MNEDFLKAIYNTIVCLGGDDELLAILDKKSTIEDITNDLHIWNSQKYDDLKSQVLKFRGIQVIVSR